LSAYATTDNLTSNYATATQMAALQQAWQSYLNGGTSPNIQITNPQ